MYIRFVVLKMQSENFSKKKWTLYCLKGPRYFGLSKNENGISGSMLPSHRARILRFGGRNGGQLVVEGVINDATG